MSATLVRLELAEAAFLQPWDFGESTHDLLDSRRSSLRVSELDDAISWTSWSWTTVHSEMELPIIGSRRVWPAQPWPVLRSQPIIEDYLFLSPNGVSITCSTKTEGKDVTRVPHTFACRSTPDGPISRHQHLPQRISLVSPILWAAYGCTTWAQRSYQGGHSRPSTRSRQPRGINVQKLMELRVAVHAELGLPLVRERRAWPTQPWLVPKSRAPFD